MLFPTVFILSSLTALAAASPLQPRSGHVVHERRSTIPHGWHKRSRVRGEAVIPLKIGLKQRNLELGADFLDTVSNPKSDKYAQHWSTKKIIDTFAPSDESINAVKAWLYDNGFSAERVKLGATKSWITVDATIDEAEELLNAKYHFYDHEEGRSHIAVDEYHLPAELSADHVDFIMPTLHFDVTGSFKDGAQKRATYKRSHIRRNSLGMDVAWMPKQGAQVKSDLSTFNLLTCGTRIVPDCLRALYDFPEGTTAAEGNSYGIVEYTPQSYRPADLDKFFGNFSPSAIGTRPINASIDGGVLVTNVSSFDINGESDLDLEYAMTLVYPQQVTLYQTGDLIEGASFNNFLDGIDASYCTFEGGDDPDPTVDAPYPDPDPEGYKGKDCGRYAATNVISTSYGYDESDLTPAYEARQCAEYLKLGLQGVTVLYSSGDYGVAGNGGQCLSNGTRFNPAFPSTCPYVTAVGATQVQNGTDIATATHPETACETVIYSGGGFSNNFAMPSYQADAVASYLYNYPPPYTSKQYNNSGTVRAYPDVSANGANYVVAVAGNFSLVYGTSASSPTFGSVITLINEQRIAAGKASVGFLNPVLYANPDVLNDVISGGNQGCKTKGFQSRPGWDPVTGLGTPNYPKMLDLFLSLP